MKTNPDNAYIDPATPVGEISHIMTRDHLKLVYVVEDDKLIGTVDYQDLALKALAPGCHPRLRTAGDIMTPIATPSSLSERTFG